MREHLQNTGQITILAVVMITVITLIIISSFAFLVISEQKMASGQIYSGKAYGFAEAGIEDALFRLNDNPQYGDPNANFSYTLPEGSISVTLETPETNHNLRYITSQGTVLGRIRTIKITAQMTVSEIGFHYAIQVGQGGFFMENNSEIIGNVYSNQNITGKSKTSSEITGSAYSVETISTVKTGEDAWANTLTDCNIGRDAYYQTESGCTVTGTRYPGSSPPDSLPLPSIDIEYWQEKAQEGGTINGDYIIAKDPSPFPLGPKEITGDLILPSNRSLLITGPLWIHGNIILNSGSSVDLDEDFEDEGTIILADNPQSKTDLGKVRINSNMSIEGTSAGGVILFVSTNTSLDLDNSAIDISSNTQAAIFYAQNGLLNLNANTHLQGATGYMIHINSNSSVTYNQGLADAKFTSGPGGEWEITSWEEI